MCMNVRVISGLSQKAIVRDMISGLSPKAIVRVVISGLSPEGICAGYHNQAMSRRFCSLAIGFGIIEVEVNHTIKALFGTPLVEFGYGMYRTTLGYF
ncbi:hypothetical protein F383_35628 [Gossypium arboreum]|uniref:Uncharacterized protein n=1 Tax=Gossypium arboreum TaxID=29729 RepID=A0A0B0PW98_GOSAR|nr:hypothetical protein F383_35628 [Gossypium arboreum]